MLMQGFKQIGSMACAAMAVFLFSYSFSISLAATDDFTQGRGEFISKSGSLPVNPDNQFPFEEKDEEAGDEVQDSFSLVCVPAEILSFVSTQDQFHFIHQASGSDHIVARVPIYLAKRALII